MESKLIHKAANYVKSQVIWENQSSSESEWMYIGLGDEIKKKLILEELDKIFDDEIVFLVKGRETSKIIQRESFEEELSRNVGLNFQLCNEKFTKFAEFHEAGIMRVGKR